MVTKVETQATYFVCGGVQHLAQNCPTYSEMREIYKEQCNALAMFIKPFSPYSDTYNPSLRNHPNFSWKSDQNQPTSSNNWNTKAPPRNYLHLNIMHELIGIP